MQKFRELDQEIRKLSATIKPLQDGRFIRSRVLTPEIISFLAFSKTNRRTLWLLDLLYSIKRDGSLDQRKVYAKTLGSDSRVEKVICNLRERHTNIVAYSEETYPRVHLQ